MGIGRREFLKLSSLATLGFIINPFEAVVAADNVYINKKLGVLFHKPDGWGFVRIKDFGKLKDQQIFGNGIEEMKEEILEELGDPICIATKYYKDRPELKGVFSPTISLYITPKEELESLGHESFEELIKMSENAPQTYLKDFQIVKRYEPYLISGVTFYEYDTEYSFEHEDISEALKVELKVLKAEHNGFYYDFNCHQSSAQNQPAKYEFEAFKNSIKMI